MFINIRFLFYKGDSFYVPIIHFDNRYFYQWMENVSNCAIFTPN